MAGPQLQIEQRVEKCEQAIGELCLFLSKGVRTKDDTKKIEDFVEYFTGDSGDESSEGEGEVK